MKRLTITSQPCHLLAASAEGHQPATTYPRAIRIGSSLLVAYTEFSPSCQKIVIGMSNLNSVVQSGFRPIGMVDQTRANDLDNAILLMTASPATTSPEDGKRLLCFFRNHSRKTDGFECYRITCCHSEDGGQSWRFLSEPACRPAHAPWPAHPIARLGEQAIGPKTERTGGLWEPFARLDRSGHIQLYYADEQSPSMQTIVRKISRDHGKTWSAPIEIYRPLKDERMGMPSIAEVTLAKGAKMLVMTIENMREGHFVIQTLRSTDDGQTWSDCQTIYSPADGHNAGAPFALGLPHGQFAESNDGDVKSKKGMARWIDRLANGRAAITEPAIAVAFMTDEDTKRRCWFEGASLKIIVARLIITSSKSLPKLQWQSRPTLICPPQTTWPGLVALEGDAMLVLYDHQGTCRHQHLMIC
ncbi:glycoside hydrolase family 93 protein [Mixia osmundae IAM 14324]|uniref:glycoside hydrolase family 93 protein n=1 Tax=Mixia osmundae (strain CBS 9802 / IAM 14324 / JCM 22182 / KY 12970) TaxID=764103 RepID=UPI0004A546C7|nr:glycoside hydrolase family 93 protein [Mixia osmundae IAM 14324]KEI37093.1 glycoside hydrolase family 93 protein [Mixia osmundae IAM 14324]